jgi:uncharacterized paraquat-inducible protein A
MYCSACGSPIDHRSVICPRCGVPTSKYNGNDEQSSVSAGTVVGAYFLAFIAPLFGIIGGIYLGAKGRTGHGVACILLSIFLGIVYVILLTS